jgi:DNA-binding MarR family transcriptional regulator
MLEVATFLGLDKSSVTGLVDRAEGRGLVRRTSTLDDRRAVRVGLTERGRAMALKFAKQLERELGALVEGLSETDRKRPPYSQVRSFSTTRSVSWGGVSGQNIASRFPVKMPIHWVYLPPPSSSTVGTLICTPLGRVLRVLLPVLSRFMYWICV